MAIVEMTKRDSAVTGCKYTEVVASGETGDDVHVYPLGAGSSGVGCVVIAGAGTGKMEWTESDDDDVTAGTATWHDWPKGTNTGTVWDTVKKASGLRGVSVSGEVTIELLY